MKFKYFLIGIILWVVGCTSDETFLNPTSIKLFLNNRLENIIVTDIKPTLDGGFLIFGGASQTLNDRFDGTAFFYLLKIDKDGRILSDTIIDALEEGYTSNILSDDNGNFECVWSPFNQNQSHHLLKVSAEGNRISVNTSQFSLDCRLFDCGNVTKIIKRTNGKYVTLNLGLDRIGTKEFSKVYVHQIDTEDLTLQEQIAEDEFIPEEFGGFTGNNLSLVRSIYDFLFLGITEQNGISRLFYTAPSKQVMALKYVGEQNPIYSDNSNWLSGIYKQIGTENYSFTIRNRSVATSPAYWQANFGLLQQNLSFTNLSNNTENQELENLNSALKTVIREGDASELFIGGTTLSSKAVIYFGEEEYEFGGSSSQYELSDFLVINNQVIITGTTILQVTDESLNGRRVPFMITVPKSEFKP